MKARVEVHNVPDYATKKPYWVCSIDEQRRLWFYGAWNERESADHIAEIISGCVVENN